MPPRFKSKSRQNGTRFIPPKTRIPAGSHTRSFSLRIHWPRFPPHPIPQSNLQSPSPRNIDARPLPFSLAHCRINLPRPQSMISCCHLHRLLRPLRPLRLPCRLIHPRILLQSLQRRHHPCHCLHHPCRLHLHHHHRQCQHKFNLVLQAVVCLHLFLFSFHHRRPQLAPKFWSRPRQLRDSRFSQFSLWYPSRHRSVRLVDYPLYPFWNPSSAPRRRSHHHPLLLLHPHHLRRLLHRHIHHR